MIDSLIEKHFPFQNFNPGQKEAIKFAVESFLSGKKHVIIEAPTGVGKSVIATTVHKVLFEAKGSWRTTITTTTKGLQDQYVKDDPDIYDLRGKTNYGCSQGADYYNTGDCRVLVKKGSCDRETSCDYLIRRKYWCEEADLRLTNTAFQVEACSLLVCLPENRADLIVLDECHTLPTQLVEHSCLNLDLDKLTFTKEVNPRLIPDLFAFIEQFSLTKIGEANTPTPTQKNIAKLAATKIENICSALQQSTGSPAYMRSVFSQIEEMQQIGDKLKAFSDNFGKWILVSYSIGKKIELKPVYAYQVADQSLWRKADYFLHMSATICGESEYAKLIGVEDYAYMNLPNPIPVANRRNIFKPIQPMSQQNYQIDKMVEQIDKIANQHKRENGVIHSVSFKLAQDIVDRSKYSSRMLISNSRYEILNQLSKPNGTIIVSPSVETGYDFKDDLCRWQVIPKIPFGFIGDPYVKYNMERSPRWYAREAILRLVQASGRSVRGIEDYQRTYILDEAQSRLITENIDLFPEWWVDQLHIVES